MIQTQCDVKVFPIGLNGCAPGNTSTTNSNKKIVYKTPVDKVLSRWVAIEGKWQNKINNLYLVRLLKKSKIKTAYNLEEQKRIISLYNEMQKNPNKFGRKAKARVNAQIDFMVENRIIELL